MKQIVFVLSGFSFPPQEGLHSQSAELMRELRRRGWQVSCLARVQRGATMDEAAFEDWVGGLNKLQVFRSKLNYPLQLLLLWAMLVCRIPSAFGKAINDARSGFQGGSICHLEGIPLFPVGLELNSTGLVLSEVDAWSLRQTRLAASTSGMKRLFLRRYAALSRAVERSTLPHAACAHVVSSVDQAYLQQDSPAANIVCIPVALPESANSKLTGLPRQLTGEFHIVFWGDIAVPHLRSGLVDLFEAVFPRLNAVGVAICFTVIGRHEPDAALKALAGSSRFLTWVPDVNEVFRQADAIVLPDQNGTGLKNRALQAMATGVPVVGSAFAFEGIPVTDGLNAFIRSTAESFADALLAIRSPDFDRQSIAVEAIDFVRSRYLLNAVVDSWERIYGIALSEPRPGCSK